MNEQNAANDNFNTEIVRPNPATPTDVIDYANQVIAVNRRLLQCSWLTEGEKMHWNNQIRKCKNLKKTIFEYMTKGIRHDEIIVK